MTKGRKIVGIWPAEDIVGSGNPGADNLGDSTGIAVEHPDEPAKTAVSDNMADHNTGEDDTYWLTLGEPPAYRHSRLPWVGIFLSMAALGWAAFVGWSQSSGFTILPQPPAWPGIAVMACAPIAMLLLAALLLDRHSQSATNRHLRTLALLREEQTQLSERLSVIATHWQRAQTALTDKAAQLSYTALAAGQTLSDVSHTLGDRMDKAVIQAATINQQGETARRAMDALLVALPKIEEVAQRATDAMRESGQLAYQYGSQLEAKIAAVSHESSEAEQNISAIEARLSERIEALRAATAQTQTGTQQAADHFDDTLTRQREAVLAMIADLATALEDNVSVTENRLALVRGNATEAARAQIDTLASALDATDIQAAAVAATLTRASDASGKLDSSLNHIAADVEARVALIEHNMRTNMASIEASIAALNTSIDSLASNSGSATERAKVYTEQVLAVADILGGVQNDIDVALPAAVERLQGLVSASHDQIAKLPALLGTNSATVDATLVQLRAAEQSLSSQAELITVLDQRAVSAIKSHADATALVQSALDHLSSQMQSVAQGDADNLKTALQSVEESARAIVASTADKLEKALADALDRATGSAVNDRIAQISNASDQAVAAAGAASDRLMRQLITIADSSASLEARASEVAHSVESGQRNTLARQLALVSEALNSTSVDLTRLLSQDIADQAWEGYLKGDRSIFARRALKLLTAAEAKELLKRYESEDDFRGLVNRYIHDFETMLRSIMDTRDGSSLSVTLLSSDIGKIYVALAQAIERLRS